VGSRGDGDRERDFSCAMLARRSRVGEKGGKSGRGRPFAGALPTGSTPQKVGIARPITRAHALLESSFVAHRPQMPPLTDLPFSGSWVEVDVERGLLELELGIECGLPVVVAGHARLCPARHHPRFIMLVKQRDARDG
jgi:hypothetical protein